jgi:hypothetical protein
MDNRMLEAGDGTEAREMAWVERPNPSISDILMPTKARSTHDPARRIAIA